VEELTAGKPRLIVLNRVDIADPEATKQWAAYFKKRGYAVMEANAKEGQGTNRFPAAIRELLSDKIAAYTEKGQAGREEFFICFAVIFASLSTFATSCTTHSRYGTGLAFFRHFQAFTNEIFRSFTLFHCGEVGRFYVA
jgi:Fe2+ transport system protein B